MEPKGLDEIKATAPFTLPPLPFPQDALEPIISEKTISFHYGKHHKKYVDTTNELIKGTQFEKSTLEQIIRETSGKADMHKLYNNAAQVWNHWFYWNCLAFGSEKMPKGKLLDAINLSFENYDSFAKELIRAATDQFGSGYAWVVKENGRLKITTTTNANNPISQGQKAIFAIDVWEHAYYLDYQNKRIDYVTAVIGNLVNWEFVEKNLFE